MKFSLAEESRPNRGLGGFVKMLLLSMVISSLVGTNGFCAPSLLDEFPPITRTEPCPTQELGMFEIAKYESDTILLKFKSSGVRFHVVLNGKDLGVSQYGQVLTLKDSDKLHLVDRHGSYLIQSVIQNDIVGLKVVSDFTHKLKRSTRFCFVELPAS